MHFPSLSKKLLGIFSVFFIFFVVGVAYAGGQQILNMTDSNADLHAAADGINFFDFDETTDGIFAPFDPKTGEINTSWFQGPGSIRFDKNPGEPAVVHADPRALLRGDPQGLERLGLLIEYQAKLSRCRRPHHLAGGIAVSIFDHDMICRCHGLLSL